MWKMSQVDEWKPVIAMLFFDLISAVTTALLKKALAEGLDRLVLITLRQLVATIFLAPIAYFKERGKRPKLTLEILVYLFFSAALGAALSQYTFFYGLQYTTATFAITFTNMSPVITFLIAALLRVESLNMKNKAGAAKIIGTLMSFAGVMLLTLYKGVALTHQVVSSTKLTKKYPALYSSTAYMFLISSLQGGALTAAIQRRASVWVLTRTVEIVAVLYTGIMGSGVGYVLMTWCVEKRGPVFTSAFIPIIQIMVAIIDFFYLHENLYLGRPPDQTLVESKGKASGFPEMWRAGCMEQWMPTVSMVATNVVIAIMTALIKQALNQGMNRLVLITFRQMVATVFLGPIAYFKERFEALNVKSRSGSAKISGTLVSLSGAMMLTFYKGSALTHTPSSSSSPASSSSHSQAEEHDTAHWVLGSVSLLANVVGFALWLMLQRKFTRKYPAIYSATAFMSLFSCLQAGALALSIQRSSISIWALKGKIEIATVVYCGVVASGFGYLMLTYCVEKRGPVFTAAFSPLSQIFVAGIDLFILHEPLYLGSVLGSVLVILGLYLVLWGKREETAAVSKDAIASPEKPVQDVEQQQEKV
uniref:EamA domain-containing protein n=1 Tax=Oryza barthii TaxID=65489 RepID=A0A0D3GBX4_9ORYZ